MISSASAAFENYSPTTMLSSSAETTKKLRTNPNLLRILLNGGDNMFGRAVQLSFPKQSKGEEEITDSCPASHYLSMCLHPSGNGPNEDINIDEIREMNQHNGQYLWGLYQKSLHTINPPPDLRILNFESSITKSINNKDVPKWKGINYHTHVDNLNMMISPFSKITYGSSAKPPSPVIISFANNHIMDMGRKAFVEETLPALDKATSKESTFTAYVGAGKNLFEASRPATINLKDRNVTVEIYAFSSGCSGTPKDWYASNNQPGLVGLPGLYTIQDVDKAMKIAKQTLGMHEEHGERGDESRRRNIRIVSIHFGPNWAMKHEDNAQLSARRMFAHRLVDECSVDLIYGHSSHHVRGMELHNGKLILYGTGDMINDYEGFENIGEEKYNKLGGSYLVDINIDDSSKDDDSDADRHQHGDFEQLTIIPMYMNRLRLERFVGDKSKIWSPNRRQLIRNKNYSVDMCNFINKLSSIDSGDKKDNIMMEHLESDPNIPGGPVLRSVKTHQPTNSNVSKQESQQQRRD